ncbi:MAG: radical SAM protein [Candidatus Omnitrophota bacterium]
MKIGNIIRMGIGAAGCALFGRKKPLNVMLSLTDRCLSRCSYCNIPERAQPELTTEQVFGLIDQIRLAGCQRLGLWGGEPLIRDDIGQIVEYAARKGLFVTMDSNGYLIPEKIDALRYLGHLVLALDGPESEHDLNREPGSFKKVMAAVKAVSGRIPLWTITVLTKHNLDSIDFILDTAKKYGFLATFQVLHHNEILGRDREALAPPDEDYREAVRKLIEKKKKGAPIASSLAYLNHILKWPDYGQSTLSYEFGGLKCLAGRLYCNVDTDGSVYACSLLVGKRKASNFLEAGFVKAFEDIDAAGCKACLASCFTEYNYIYGLHIPVCFSWLSSMLKTKGVLCRKRP